MIIRCLACTKLQLAIRRSLINKKTFKRKSEISRKFLEDILYVSNYTGLKLTNQNVEQSLSLSWDDDNGEIQSRMLSLGEEDE